MVSQPRFHSGNITGSSEVEPFWGYVVKRGAAKPCRQQPSRTASEQAAPYIEVHGFPKMSRRSTQVFTGSLNLRRLPKEVRRPCSTPTVGTIRDTPPVPGLCGPSAQTPMRVPGWHTLALKCFVYQLGYVYDIRIPSFEQVLVLV